MLLIFPPFPVRHPGADHGRHSSQYFPNITGVTGFDSKYLADELEEQPLHAENAENWKERVGKLSTSSLGACSTSTKAIISH